MRSTRENQKTSSDPPDALAGVRNLHGRTRYRRFRFRLRHSANVSFQVVPFEYSYKRTEHFDKHCTRRGEFLCRTELEYEARADVFMTNKRRITTLQCRRPQGGIVRYDLFTKEFGVVGQNGFVVTYFLARPVSHGYPFNVCYFLAQCRRIF